MFHLKQHQILVRPQSSLNARLYATRGGGWWVQWGVTMFKARGKFYWTSWSSVTCSDVSEKHVQLCLHMTQLAMFFTNWNWDGEAKNINNFRRFLKLLKWSKSIPEMSAFQKTNFAALYHSIKYKNKKLHNVFTRLVLLFQTS